MLSRIPSWAVAVAGAAIAIAATATSTMLLHQTRADITAVKSEIADTRRAVDRLWSSHLQADQRSTAADVFFAQALGSDTSRSFLLEQAAYQLRGAVLSMWAASGEPVPDKSARSDCGGRTPAPRGKRERVRVAEIGDRPVATALTNAHQRAG